MAESAQRKAAKEDPRRQHADRDGEESPDEDDFLEDDDEEDEDQDNRDDDDDDEDEDEDDLDDSDDENEDDEDDGGRGKRKQRDDSDEGDKQEDDPRDRKSGGREGEKERDNGDSDSESNDKIQQDVKRVTIVLPLKVILISSLAFMMVLMIAKNFAQINLGQTLLRALLLFCSSLQTGACLYVNIAEHPSRLECGTRVAFKDFLLSYRRASKLIATLATTAMMTAFTTYFMSNGDGAILTSAILSASTVIFSIIFVFPIDVRLLRTASPSPSHEIQQLLEKWGRLHTVRTLLTAFCTIVILSSILYDNPNIVVTASPSL